MRFWKKLLCGVKAGCGAAPAPGRFRAAGKIYAGEAWLAAQSTDKERIFLDVYGRTVLRLRERFPCFDHADLLYENRYEYWYFILYRDMLTLVYTKDESSAYAVTERMTKAQWECCGLDGYNRDQFRRAGFDRYLL